MTSQRTFAICAIAVAGAIALSGCSAPSTPTTSGGVTLVKPGTLTACINLPFKPMEYKDDSGVVVGFDVDIVNLVATQLGTTVTVVESDFDQITSGALFAAKKCDIAASSITITDARAQAINFSKPYFAATQGLAATAASGIHGLADLSGKKVAVESNTTGQDYANANADQYGFEVVVFDDAGAALNSILSGRVDACLVDLAIVTDFVRSNDGMAVAAQFSTNETYGIAAAKTDNGAALITAVNSALDKANTDGTYLQLYQKWIDPSATSASLPS